MVVALDVLADLLGVAPGVLVVEVDQEGSLAQDLAGVDVEVGGLSLHALRPRLMDDDQRVGKREAAPWGARRQQQ